MNPKKWIGVDLDGTLAHYDGWRGPRHIGEPVPEMVERVKRWLSQGQDVRIFTGRIAPWVRQFVSAETSPTSREIEEAFQSFAAIEEWCEQHLGRRLPITCIKDLCMLESWDDRGIQVETNTGRRIGDLSPRNDGAETSDTKVSFRRKN